MFDPNDLPAARMQVTGFSILRSTIDCSVVRDLAFAPDVLNGLFVDWGLQILALCAVVT